MTKSKLALGIFLSLTLGITSFAEMDVGPYYHGRMPVEANFHVATAGNATYNIIEKTNHPRVVKRATFKCSSGTIRASLAIDGTDITNCGGTSYTSVSSTAATSGDCNTNNVLGVGKTLSIITDTNSSCLNFTASVDMER